MPLTHPVSSSVSSPTSRRRAKDIGAPRVVAVTDARDLAAHRTAWTDLVQDAIEPNSFYEPWSLIPLLEAFGEGDWTVLFIYDDAEGDESRSLIGVVPLQKSRLRVLPWPIWSLWENPYCFHCVPLLRQRVAARALSAVGKWINRSTSTVPLLDWHHVSADGPLRQTLGTMIYENSWTATSRDSYGRALLVRCDDSETYQQEKLSRHQRHELRRQRRRLAELGPLEARVCQPDDNVEKWIEDFLALEAAGWKGRDGTAISSKPTDREWFTRSMRAGFAEGRVGFLGLFLNDRPVALKCNFLCPPGSYAFKIAFDESYPKFSPGVLLEIDNIDWFHDQTDLEWMDSCAARDHSMINRIWADRRQIERLLVAPGYRGQAYLAAWNAMQSAKNAWQHWKAGKSHTEPVQASTTSV